MKTAIEKPVTPGGVFDHLMVPQGGRAGISPLQGPKDNDRAGVLRGGRQISVLE